MRTIAAALLLAAAAWPAAAQLDPREDSWRGLRGGVGELRRDAPERPTDPRSDPSVLVERPQPPETVEAAPSLGGSDVRLRRRDRLDGAIRPRTGPELNSDLGQRYRDPLQPTGDSVRDWRLPERLARRRQPVEPVVPPELAPLPPVREGLAGRSGAADLERGRRLTGRASVGDGRSLVVTDDFRHHWRRDRRYDWRSHRDRYGDRFRLGWYHDPFGWGHRQWVIGSSIRPSYWGESYWLRDPWQWRLPSVAGPYRWIRYYDDVLLVDLRSGRVVDVIAGFFW